jgi:three-Cys-motif partner protein
MPTGELVIGSDNYLALAVGPWAKEKLFYIQSYCKIFNSGMKNKWPVRTYIDVFSGPGRCIVEDTGEEIDGSPLVALQCKVPFTHYFFNDINVDSIQSLKNRLSSFSSTDIELFNSDCNDVIGELKSKLPPSSLDFCFVDPLNWEIKFASLRFLTEGRNMDLAITFHSGNMKRVVDDYPNVLNNFFGDDEWQLECKNAMAKGQVKLGRALLDAYEKRLKKLGYMVIHDFTLIKNTMGVPLYHLVFASKHPRGKDFWSKISQKTLTGQRRMVLE